MSFLTNSYSIACTHCGKDVEFTPRDISDLKYDFDDACDEASKETRTEVEREFAGMVDPDDLPVQPRDMHELAVAIKSGNLFEAEILLDRIAEEFGMQHREAVQQGLFSPEARRRA